MTNSRQKGARGERAAAKFLTSLGIPCERAARIGVKDGQDLMLPPEYDIHIEVKNDNHTRPGTKAMEDALNQANAGAEKYGKHHRCVLWHEPRKGWRLTCRSHLDGPKPTVEMTAYREEDIAALIMATKRG